MIISLTTIPPRINYLEPVIGSLKRQTIKPSKILIWIPKEYTDKWGKIHTYTIPTFLKNDNLIEIIECEDYGPATKFLHAIKNLDKDEEFIVVDDDTIYSEYMIENLSYFPEIDAPKAIKGVYFEDGARKNKKIKLDHHSNATRTIGLAEIICGCDGYTLKPKFFNEKIFKIPEEYKKCDDIWLSGFLTAQKIKKYIVPCRLLSYEKYEEEIKQLWANRPTRPPRWRDKLPHPHVRYVDHVFAINGGKYEKEDTYKNIVEYLKNE